jgi:lipid II:glycine glycyltransferase (peptidoglycan interpeptide bridge formation enzyme)
MHVDIITSKELWNEAVVSFTDDTFHQAWEWGETYKRRGLTAWNIALLDEHSEIIGVALTIKVKARRGSFLLVPHGPLFCNTVQSDPSLLKKCLGLLTEYLVTLAKEEGCVFVRLAPTQKRTPEMAELYRSSGYRQAPIFVQSELSWRLNLQPPEQELLANMRKSTRYILKRSDTYGVHFESTADPESFDRFYNLYLETVKNQEYVGHSKDFIYEEFRTFAESGMARFYFIYTNEGGQKKDLATALIITQGSSGFYHYGGSRKDEKNTPAPHLLQWHIIKDLKNNGFFFYNFWGISEEDKPNHPWRGLTVFKKGFGGEELAYVKTQDYILHPFYWFNWVVETVRRIKRNY